jgi:hypothetical protein
VIDVLREIQLPVLAVVLLAGAAAKAAARTTRGQGPAALLPERARRPFTYANAAVEALLAVALLLLAGPLGEAARALTFLVFAAALVVLVVVSRRHPELGCGCFGGFSTSPVGRRTLARTVLFGVAAASTLGLPATGMAVLGGLTAGHVGVLAAEAVLLAVLSPEVTGPLSALVRPGPCERREVPAARTLARLRASDVWYANASVVTGAEPVDMWRQGCWRMLRYAGRRNGRAVDVVFAVPVQGRRPVIRAAISDAETGATLAVLGEVAGVATSRLDHRRQEPAPTGTVLPVDVDPYEPA